MKMRMKMMMKKKKKMELKNQSKAHNASHVKECISSLEVKLPPLIRILHALHRRRPVHQRWQSPWLLVGHDGRPTVAREHRPTWMPVRRGRHRVIEYRRGS